MCMGHVVAMQGGLTAEAADDGRDGGWGAEDVDSEGSEDGVHGAN